MDRLLGREFDAIASDHRSGAADLALRAVTALQAWLRRHPNPAEADLLAIARALLHAQPAMAPLLRLANEVALCADANKPARALFRSTTEFGRILRSAREEIARRFARALRPDGALVATYSYSSTILQALWKARRRIVCVLCSESRPGNEGRAMAREIARAGIMVTFSTDLALASRMDQVSVFATGADAILPDGFVNKAGTGVLVLCALKARRPVWIVADRTKFVPEPMAARFWRARIGPGSEVWPQAPVGVEILNPLFEPAEFHSRTRVLSESGWMTPAQVRGEMKKIRVSPRSKDWAN